MSSGWPENWSYMNTNNVLNTLLSTPLNNTPGAAFFIIMQHAILIVIA